MLSESIYARRNLNRSTISPSDTKQEAPSQERPEIDMAKVAPFHSKSAGSAVYHECANCTAGKRVKSKNRVSGKGSRAKCDECARRMMIPELRLLLEDLEDTPSWYLNPGPC